MSHIPVLLEETIDILDLKRTDVLLDATFGGGGHSKEILERSSSKVVAIDRDPEASSRAMDISSKYPDRFKFIQGRFGNISEIFLCGEKFDAALFDFGVSSFQLDDPERGFSFSKSGLLDMRMSNDSGVSAFDVVNSFSASDLAEIIWTYGEEPMSRKIADSIVLARKTSKIQTTSELRDIVTSVFNRKYSKIDPATKTFQAIRIFVNDELREIDLALRSLPDVLNPGSRVVFISFHGLEDGIIKNFGRSSKLFRQINKKPIRPSDDEISKNPRSRSAILRAFIFGEGIC